MVAITSFLFEDLVVVKNDQWPGTDIGGVPAATDQNVPDYHHVVLEKGQGKAGAPAIELLIRDGLLPHGEREPVGETAHGLQKACGERTARIVHVPPQRSMRKHLASTRNAEPTPCPTVVENA